MKRIFLITYLLANTSLFAQSGNELSIYMAYLTSDLDSLEKFVVANNYDEVLKSRDIQLLTSELETYYILLSGTLSYEEEEATFDKYVDRHIELAERIISLDEKNGIAHAMLSGIYGLKIAYSPMKGMFLGPKNSSHSSKSMELDGEDPLVLLMYGINKYNTPSAWGGDINATINALNKVIKIYEEQSRVHQNWKYLHALAWLGIAYEDKKDKAGAKKAYEKSLEMEPGFNWGKILLSEIDL